jgi:thiol:disulfide interchange protein
MRSLAAVVGCLVAFGSFAAGPTYPDVSSAKADIDAAMKQARAERKRVLVDFGGNWCGDCKVLEANFHRTENAALLQSEFVLVHVNVGDKGISHNFDVAERYGIALKKGVPALAVLEGDGRVVYAHKNGEFGDMRKMDPASVHEFLKQWSRARPK